MGIPNSRTTLIDYCKRQLGWPVLDINVDDDQVEDRVDEALQFFQQYHFDSMQKFFLKHQVTQQDIDRKYIDLTKGSGLVSTTGGSNVVIGSGTNFSEEYREGQSLISIEGEIRQVANIQSTTSMMVNANFTLTNTNVPITNYSSADSIIGVNRIFPFNSTSRMSMFDIQYQLRLNDLYTFTSTSYVNYEITMQHLRTLEMIFTGENTVRFNRHQNRLYIDFQWGTDVVAGEYLIIEAYKIINPDDFPNVYNDMYLKRYLTALIKRQWGQNLIKFVGLQLPGGIALNGRQIFDDAIREIQDLEKEIRSTFEAPPQFLVRIIW